MTREEARMPRQSVSMPADLWSWLEEKARQDDRTVSGVIRLLVAKAKEDDDRGRN